MNYSDKLFLVGLPGSGKSALGKQIAEKLQHPFVDLDNLVEEQEGMSIPEIFKKHGEDYFRKVESRCLQDQINLNPKFIMATGGGSPCYHKGIDKMLASGTVIYVDVPIPVLMERIIVEGTTKRPKFGNDVNLEDKLKKLRNERIFYYGRAQIKISGADITPDMILDALQA